MIAGRSANNGKKVRAISSATLFRGDWTAGDERSTNMDLNKHPIRGIQRYPITTRRYCSMGIIAFKKLEWKDYIVRIVDISIIGIGIESNQRIEPGVVWFKERVGGYKSGVLLWSKQDGSRYRGGIKFVSLSRDEEEYLQEQFKESRSQRPFHDPHKIISSLIEFCKKEHGDTH